MLKSEGERVEKALRRISSNIERLYEARKLVDAGKYEKALASYLSGIRGSVGNLPDLELASTLTTLLTNHPSAKKPLSTRRDELEVAIENGSNSRCLNEEWMELNKALGDRYRELELIERLRQSAHRTDDFTIFQTIKGNFEKYLGDRRYEVLAPYIDRFGHHFLMYYVDYETDVLFPDAVDRRCAFVSAGAIESIRNKGVMLFEACLGLGRNVTASEIARKVFAASNNVDTYAQFIGAAKRARRDDYVKELLKQAKKVLSGKEMKELNRVKALM